MKEWSSGKVEDERILFTLKSGNVGVCRDMREAVEIKISGIMESGMWVCMCVEGRRIVSCQRGEVKGKHEKVGER